jgi:hypothetical protein
MSVPTLPPAGTRDHRLDVFRGLALITIFINHVPKNAFERYTSRNFGFSDAAEAFVLMSGIAVGLAYANGFRAGDLGKALLRVWRRAGKLYVTHIVISAMALAIVAAGVLFLDAYVVARRVDFMQVMQQPLQTMIGMPLLAYQIGYFNILPLYFVLLVVSPLYIMIGLRSRLALVLLAVAIWALAGIFRLNIPRYPGLGGWFFNPLSWQLVYAIGIAAGLSVTERRKLVPFNPWLFGIAAALLLFAAYWVQMRMGGLPGGKHLPFFIGGFDKTFLSLPRLLHVLALAYVLTNLGAVTWLLAKPVFRPIGLMGQQGLVVFATGSVLSIALQVFRAWSETSAVDDGVLLLGGIFIQYGIARFLSATAEKKPSKKIDVAAPAADATEVVVPVAEQAARP